MEDSTKVGGARDSAGRPVSKLLISRSHAVKREHHGDSHYEVPNNDSVQYQEPCFVGVSDLQLGNTGTGMSNTVPNHLLKRASAFSSWPRSPLF